MTNSTIKRVQTLTGTMANGTGVRYYEDLPDKPSINDVVLEKNKTTKELFSLTNESDAEALFSDDPIGEFDQETLVNHPTLAKYDEKAKEYFVKKEDGKSLITDQEQSKLEGIEEQATRVLVDDFLSSDSLNAIQNKVVKQAIDDIIAVGAQPNVIESIAVNGQVQDIENKQVNITMPTKVSDLENDSQYVTDPEFNEKTKDLSSIKLKVDGKKEVIGICLNVTDSYFVETTPEEVKVSPNMGLKIVE